MNATSSAWPVVSDSLLSSIRREAVPLTGSPADHDGWIDRVGDARVVLLGEATHGTHEFYRERAVITKRLIEEKGFTAVAIEADWPDAFRVNRFVQGANDDTDAEEALSGFRRFPTWMWRNAEVLDFVGWLRSHNEGRERKTGFYGLDLYSLYRSIEEVVSYLERIDPAAAEDARQRYACLENFEESQNYGYAAARGLTPSCRDGVIQQLIDLQAAGEKYLRRDGIAAEDEQFYAEANARLVVAAEEYYRSMFTGPASSWNLRDSHMEDTLERLVSHQSSRDGGKTVVWAHNSHVGDARNTSMSIRGEHNLGQLTRGHFGTDAFLVGFSTYEGTVSAASSWDSKVERKRVRPAIPGSFEAVFHETGMPAFWLGLSDGGDAAAGLAVSRPERAIGVIYRPDTEIASHYLQARLSIQFDLVIHIDSTRAVEPLETSVEWHQGEPPETYPVAI